MATQMKKHRGRLVGPTLEAVLEMGIDRHTQPGEVKMATLSRAAETMLKAGLNWAIEGWALEELERISEIAFSEEDESEISFKERRHALAAVRCASRQINKNEVDLVLEEQRRERSNGSSKKKKHDRKKGKREEDRRIRALMKGKTAGG